MKFFWVLSLMVSLKGFLFAYATYGDPWKKPWFTGSILSLQGHTNPPKILTVQPYLFFTSTYGKYEDNWTSHRVTPLNALECLIHATYGLTHFMDVEVLASFVYQNRGSANHATWQDTSLLLGFQALEDNKYSWEPNLRIALQQVFPTGRYDKLKSKKRGTDATGEGSYQTGINFDFQKLFKLESGQFFRGRLCLQYLFLPLSVSIQGISIYGGTEKARGTIKVGQTFTLITAGEYTITQNWVLAMDVQYQLKSRSRFSGKIDNLAKRNSNKVGYPLFQQISIAPAIEYNFSKNIGVIGGFWFTLAGMNAPQFASGVISGVFTF